MLHQMIAHWALRITSPDGEVLDRWGSKFESGESALLRARRVRDSLYPDMETACYEVDEGWDVEVTRPEGCGLPEAIEIIQVRREA